jgi:hypothetical protein
MRLRNLLVRLAVPAALVIASIGAGWKWEKLPLT